MTGPGLTFRIDPALRADIERRIKNPDVVIQHEDGTSTLHWCASTCEHARQVDEMIAQERLTPTTMTALAEAAAFSDAIWAAHMRVRAKLAAQAAGSPDGFIYLDPDDI